MLKQQKRARAAAWISACVLCIMMVLSSWNASAVSDSDNILYLNIPDSPELLQPCEYDRKILFFGTGCTFHATIRIGDGGNWGPLIPIGGKDLIDTGANAGDKWGPLIPINGSENGGTVSTQAETRSGGGLIVVDQQDIDLYIYGMVTLAATKEDGLRIEWSKNCTVQNSANMDLQLGDFEFRNGKWSNTDTKEYRVTSVKDIRIEIPTDQSYLVDGGELKTYLGIRIQNGYDQGYESGFDAGNREGWENGWKNGWELGFEEGFDYGNQIGYGNGYEDGTDYGEMMAQCLAVMQWELIQGRDWSGVDLEEAKASSWLQILTKMKNEAYVEGYEEGFDVGNCVGYEEGWVRGRDDGVNILAKMEAVRAWERLRGRGDSIGELNVNVISGKTWTQIIQEFNDEAYKIGDFDGFCRANDIWNERTNNGTVSIVGGSIQATWASMKDAFDPLWQYDIPIVNINVGSLMATVVVIAVIGLVIAAWRFFKK